MTPLFYGKLHLVQHSCDIVKLLQKALIVSLQYYYLEALIQSTTPLRALFLPWYPMVSFIRFDPADWKLPGDNQRGWNSVFKVTRVIHIARYFLYVRTVQKWIELT